MKKIYSSESGQLKRSVTSRMREKSIRLSFKKSLSQRSKSWSCGGNGVSNVEGDSYVLVSEKKNDA